MWGLRWRGWKYGQQHGGVISQIQAKLCPPVTGVIMKTTKHVKSGGRSIFQTVSFLCGAVFALQACSSAVQEESGPSGGTDSANTVATGSLALSEAQTAALVDDYLFKTVSKDEAKEIQQKVRSLDRETMRRFHRMALDRGAPTPEQRKFSEESLRYAETKGTSFLDLQKDDMRHVLATVTGIALEKIPLDPETGAVGAQPQDVVENGAKVTSVGQAACYPGYSSCGYTTLWSGGAGKTICNGTTSCTPGVGWDYTGNSPCELGGCDTRVWFNRSNALYVDGVTAGANCVISWYGALGRYSSGGWTYIGYGVLGPISCVFFPANPAANFQMK